MRTQLKDDQLMTRDMLAKKLVVSLATVKRLARAGKLGTPLYIGRSPRWKESDIDVRLENGQLMNSYEVTP